MSRYLCHPTLSKSQVIDAYDGLFDHVIVNCSVGSSFSFELVKFGRFELDWTEYVYGTGLEEFEAVMNDPTKTSFALSIAKETPEGLILAPFFDFTDEEQEQIQQYIQEKFASQMTMLHYCEARC